MPRFALGLAALALVLVTTACDDDPEPKITDPTSEATSDPTTSDPPTSSANPDPKPLTPIATVRAWIGGQNEALLRGSFEEVDSLTLPRCGVCADFLQPMRDIYEDGGRFETKGWRIASIKAGLNGRSSNDVSVAIVIPGGATYASASAEPVQYRTERRIMVFRVGQRRSGESGIANLEFLG